MANSNSQLNMHFDSLPLSGRNIVITRSVEQAGESLLLFEAEGASVIPISTIAFNQIALDETRLQNIVARYYDYIVFTSANGVTHFFDQLNGKLMTDVREHCKIITIGEKTRALCERRWLNVVYSPKEYNAKALVKELEDVDWKNAKVLIPGSSISRKELFEGLHRLGANVDTVPVYDTVMPPRESVLDRIQQIKNTEIDCYTFMSPSAFTNFLRLMEVNGNLEFFKNSSIAAVGMMTAETIREVGYEVDIIPEKATLESIVLAVKNFFTNI